MPTYQYRCNECGQELEVVQKFSDASLTVCPNCEGDLRKVFNAVGVVFKGSGFYRTDSRKGGDLTKSGSTSSTKSEKPTESKPKVEASTTKSSDSNSSSTSSASTAKAAASN